MCHVEHAAPGGRDEHIVGDGCAGKRNFGLGSSQGFVIQVFEPYSLLHVMHLPVSTDEGALYCFPFSPLGRPLSVLNS